MTTRDTCPCCGETYEATMDGLACACEWDGCDENCPHVAYLLNVIPGRSDQ